MAKKERTGALAKLAGVLAEAKNRRVASGFSNLAKSDKYEADRLASFEGNVNDTANFKRIVGAVRK